MKPLPPLPKPPNLNLAYQALLLINALYHKDFETVRTLMQSKEPYLIQIYEYTTGEAAIYE